MLKRKKPAEDEIRELRGIARASDELSVALREFDQQAESWARLPEAPHVVHR
jgi:hypothetical protein